MSNPGETPWRRCIVLCRGSLSINDRAFCGLAGDRSYSCCVETSSSGANAGGNATPTGRPVQGHNRLTTDSSMTKAVGQGHDNGFFRFAKGFAWRPGTGRAGVWSGRSGPQSRL